MFSEEEIKKISENITFLDVRIFDERLCKLLAFIDLLVPTTREQKMLLQAAIDVKSGAVLLQVIRESIGGE